jgi:cyclohexyl-isocyanide hydratase
MQQPASLRFGVVVFPGITQLDATGPCEVFASLENASVELVGAAPVSLPWGLTLSPRWSFEDAPAFDVVCVPGGAGVNALMEDERCLGFLRRQAETVRALTAVCTGSLVLGAAGLLRGYRATTHWMSLELLRAFGAEPVAERVVRDRNRITGGGVTAGLDFAFALVAELRGRALAERLQLALEYDPEPPFATGSPRSAPAEVVAAARERASARQEERERVVQRAAARLGGARP